MEAATLATKHQASSAAATKRIRRFPRRGAIVSVLLLAFAAPGSVGWHAQARKSPAAWVAAPLVEVPLAAEPQAAHPPQPLGDCDAPERLLIATEMVFHRCQLVAISLFGGLYGS